MLKEEKVIKYYVLCNKLKDVIRTGWKDWNVERSRLESVAEHIYGVQMLAIAMKSEFQYDLDISKVLFMLAIHELEEIFIGDLTLFQISKKEKEKMGHGAIAKFLDEFIDKERLLDLVLEFDERKTAEAKFAFQCDKLECALQCKIYDEEGCVDLKKQQNNKSFYNNNVQNLLKEQKTWSEMWLTFWEERASYDENFTKVSNYAKENKININIENN